MIATRPDRIGFLSRTPADDIDGRLTEFDRPTERTVESLIFPTAMAMDDQDAVSVAAGHMAMGWICALYFTMISDRTSRYE